MKDRYEIDDFMRRKLENRAFEYDHANWVSAVEYILNSKKPKRKEAFCFGLKTMVYWAVF
jgi:hypothetical protein